MVPIDGIWLIHSNLSFQAEGPNDIPDIPVMEVVHFKGDEVVKNSCPLSVQHYHRFTEEERIEIICSNRLVANERHTWLKEVSQ